MAKVSARQAAIDYLTENNGGPLPVKDVTAEAARRAKLKGKTPAATVAAIIYTDAKKTTPTFTLPERGQVALAPVTADTPAATPEKDSEADADPSPASSVEVTPHPKPASTPRKSRRVPAAA